MRKRSHVSGSHVGRALMWSCGPTRYPQPGPAGRQEAGTAPQGSTPALLIPRPDPGDTQETLQACLNSSSSFAIPLLEPSAPFYTT